MSLLNRTPPLAVQAVSKRHASWTAAVAELDCRKRHANTRRKRLQNQRQREADSAPGSSVCEVTLAILKSHGAGFVLVTGRRFVEWRDSGARILRQTRVARREVAPDSTRRATGGRFHQVYQANTQRKGFKNGFKVAKISTFQRRFDDLPGLLGRRQRRIRPPRRSARLFRAGLAQASPGADRVVGSTTNRHAPKTTRR